ncbi:unnamed protein product, partial [Rotaria sordida]
FGFNADPFHDHLFHVYRFNVN